MYVPASDERKTKKAATLKVDTIVFDLEDGVAVSQKVLGQPSAFQLPLTENECSQAREPTSLIYTQHIMHAGVSM